MRKGFLFFVVAIYAVATNAVAATTRAMRSGTTAVERTANPLAGYNYNYMYPYLNNDMRVALNPGVTTSQSTSPINAVVRTEQLGTPRRVVPRPTAARAATNPAARVSNTARAATPNTAMRTTGANMARSATGTGNNANGRRVVARSAANSARISPSAARSSRFDVTQYNRTMGQLIENPPTNTVPSSRCLADYVQCMEGYCKHEDLAYNRCYCSAKLSQIDAKYQSKIDSLIKQLIMIQGTNRWSAEEMNEYWMSVIGKYTGGNSWVNLENALNIDWASVESRVSGQQAFATGHEYCVQHLNGCYYMSNNMRDVYISQISRDCQTYEQGLQRIQNAAESLVENYQ